VGTALNSALSLVFAITAMLGFGLADFIAKAILTKANVYRTLLISQTIGTVPFLGVALMFDFNPPSQSILPLALCSGALSAIVMLSFYSALRLGKATLVSPIASCLSVFAVVLSVVVLGERLTVAQLILIVAVFVGIVLVGLPERTNGKASHFYLSILLALLVIFLGGGNAIFQKWVSLADHTLVNFAVMRLSMIGSLAACQPILGQRADIRARGTRKEYVALILLGLVDAFGFFAYYMGFRAGFVSIVAPIANSSAAVTIVLARLFLSERVPFHQRIGVITILAAIALLSVIS